MPSSVFQWYLRVNHVVLASNWITHGETCYYRTPWFVRFVTKSWRSRTVCSKVSGVHLDSCQNVLSVWERAEQLVRVDTHDDGGGQNGQNSEQTHKCCSHHISTIRLVLGIYYHLVVLCKCAHTPMGVVWDVSEMTCREWCRVERRDCTSKSLSSPSAFLSSLGQSVVVGVGGNTARTRGRHGFGGNNGKRVVARQRRTALRKWKGHISFLCHLI